MDPRFKQISDLLSDYSIGHFGSSMAVSEKMDDIDAFISTINMLGEELKTTTISKNYFNNIFNSVSDLVFVLDAEGLIENANRTAENMIGLELSVLTGLPVDTLLAENEKPLTLFIDQNLNSGNGLLNDQRTGGIETERKLKTVLYGNIPVSCGLSILDRGRGNKTSCLLTVRDLRKQKEMENLVIHTIIDTQENERIRVAKDLHDSLGQQLSAVKFYLETMIETGKDKNIHPVLLKSNAVLKAVQAELRDICFDLMPKTLEICGLIESVEELCRKTEIRNLLEFEIKKTEGFPSLDKSLEIALFRIIQEFINNAIKHGKAKKIELFFQYTDNPGEVALVLKDDGEGFDMDKVFSSKGMGLKNVRSRIQSYNGTIVIQSAPAGGTSYSLTIPLDKNLISKKTNDETNDETKK